MSRERLDFFVVAAFGLASVVWCPSSAAAQSDAACPAEVQQYWDSVARPRAHPAARTLSAPCHRLFVESIVGRLPSLARSRDAALFSHLALDAQRYRDASLAQRGLELFSDGSATDEARWFGLVQAARHFRNARLLKPDLDAQRRDIPRDGESPRPGQCLSSAYSSGELRLAPTGATYDTVYADRLREVRRRPETSPFLRGMIACVSIQISHIAPAVRPGEVIARNVCGNRWLLRYSGPEEVVVVNYGPSNAPGSLSTGLWPGREIPQYLPFAADLRVTNRGRTILIAPHAHVSCYAQSFRDRGERVPDGADTLSYWQWRSRPDSAPLAQRPRTP